MYRLAKIENNVITQVVESDELYQDWVRVDTLTPQPGPGWTYENDTFSPPPAPLVVPNTKFSKFQFRSRFTLQELVSVDNAGVNPGLDTMQKATLNTIGKNFDAAEFIDITDPATIQGIQYLVSVGLLTPQRGTEILTP